VADRPTLFVDRSLGKGVGRRPREAGATVELHDDHFEQNTTDSTWIPDVKARGWVILTKGKNIRRPSGEREGVLTAGVRVFTLVSGNLSGQRMAELFIQNLNLAEIERVSEVAIPPFAYTVGPEGCRPVPIQPVPPSIRDIESEPEEGDGGGPVLR